MPMETRPSKAVVTQAEIMDTPCTRESSQEEFHILEPDLEILQSRSDGIFGSISTDADDDIQSVDSLEDEEEELPTQNFTTLPVKDLTQATKDWAETQELPQELPALHKKGLVQDLCSLDWEKAKDDVEKRAGIKPYCPLCRTDSHTEAQCVSARIRHASKRKSSDGEDSKPGNVTIRKKKNFKKFKCDLEQVVSRGGILMTFSM